MTQVHPALTGLGSGRCLVIGDDRFVGFEFDSRTTGEGKRDTGGGVRVCFDFRNNETPVLRGFL